MLLLLAQHVLLCILVCACCRASCSACSVVLLGCAITLAKFPGRALRNAFGNKILARPGILEMPSFQGDTPASSLVLLIFSGWLHKARFLWLTPHWIALSWLFGLTCAVGISMPLLLPRPTTNSNVYVEAWVPRSISLFPIEHPQTRAASKRNTPESPSGRNRGVLF